MSIRQEIIKLILAGVILAWTAAPLSFAQSGMPSFQYDAAAFYADKELTKVAEATRLALENNWRIRITAPSEWRDRLMQAVERAAGGQPVSVDFTDTIIESVVINLTQKGSPKRKKSQSRATSANTAPVALPAAKVSRPESEKPSREGVFEGTVNAPDIMTINELRKPELPLAADRTDAQDTPTGARQPKKAQASGALELEKAPPGTALQAAPPESKETIQPVETDKAEAAEAPAAVSAVDPRQWLQNTYFDGQEVTRWLSLEKIRNDDRIMVKDNEFLLMRMSHGRRSAWWLKSPVNLASDGIEEIRPGQYRVNNKVRLVKDSRPQNQEKKQDQGEVKEQVAPAVEAPAVEAERKRLQKLYNKGRKIKKTLRPKNINKNDIIIVGKEGLKLLVRSERDGSLRRYWLTGDVNLDNPDVFRKESSIKYVALRKYTPDDAR